METTRKLATVSTVASVANVLNSDRLDVITFTTNGWMVVVGRDECKVGDRIIFFEIDSFLPREDRYYILEGRCDKVMNGQHGYRIKSIKLRGQISQGFAVPLTEFPEFNPDVCYDGRDVTADLKVQLYESQPAQVGRFGFAIGRAATKFPGFIKKTDQTRIQAMSNTELWQMIKHPFEITVKEDGTSCTMYYKDGKFGVCSRNLTIRDPDEKDPLWLIALRQIKYASLYVKYIVLLVWCFLLNIIKQRVGRESQRPPRAPRRQPQHWFEASVYWDMCKKYDIRSLLTTYCRLNKRELAFQGEIVGPGIQKNRGDYDERRYKIFDIFDIQTQRYLLPSERRAVIKNINECIEHSNTANAQSDFMSHVIGIPLEHVAELHEVETSENNDWNGQFVLDHDESSPNDMSTARALVLAIADGNGVKGKPREGLVFKSKIDARSFKAISNEYLLKAEKEDDESNS
jgi:RNA ligase (TIGR02306 family)